MASTEKNSFQKDSDAFLNLLHIQLKEEDKQIPKRPFHQLEIKEALFQTGNWKAPGPDGFPVSFYQEYWDIEGSKLSKSILSCLNQTNLLQEWIQTKLSLIPKVNNTSKLSHFRPISLCNVLYKVVAKVSVNRLKMIMPNIISSFQNVFISIRLIADNILIAYKAFEFIRKRKKGKRGFAALKLSTRKAYGRVSWQFLIPILRKMGFPSSWISLIYNCMATVQFAISINGIVFT